MTALLSNLIVIPIFIGGLFVWPFFLILKRDSNPALCRQLRQIFITTLVILVGLIFVAKFVGHPLLFPTVNFASILFSGVVWIRDDKSMRQCFKKPSMAAVAGMMFVFTAVMLNGGFQNLDIALSGTQTVATVTGTGEHGAFYYQYEVNGHSYKGSAYSGNPPYPKGGSNNYPIGDTYEIRYSSVHPYFSLAESPFTLLGQMLVGMVFVGGGAYFARYNALKRKNKMAGVANGQ